MPLNAALKLAFFEAGKRQVDVAAALGMDNSRLSQIIHGRLEPTSDEKRGLAKALKKSVGDLFPEVAA